MTKQEREIKAIKTVFSQFLKDNNAFTQYLVNRDEIYTKERCKEKVTPLDILSKEFYWSKTPQGDSFWRKLYSQWLDILSDLHQKKLIHSSYKWCDYDRIPVLKQDYS